MPACVRAWVLSPEPQTGVTAVPRRQCPQASGQALQPSFRGLSDPQDSLTGGGIVPIVQIRKLRQFVSIRITLARYFQNSAHSPWLEGPCQGLSSVPGFHPLPHPPHYFCHLHVCLGVSGALSDCSLRSIPVVVRSTCLCLLALAPGVGESV